MAASLSARLRKRHGELTLEADFTLAPGVTALVGPSGSGKTTLLRCLAGLTRPESGHIAYGDECWLDTDRRCDQPPQARRVGLIFQSHALFPHLDLRRNVSFAATSAARVDELLALLDLSGLAGRYPHEVSAGQAQRAAIARALAADPRILAMDEPFANLDAPLKSHLYEELAALFERLALPVLLVTHDMSEACRLASRMLVLTRGRIVQDDSPEAVLYRPATAEVAAIAGIRNVFEGVALTPRTLAFGPHALDAETELVPGATYRYCFRADAVELGEAGLPAVVTDMRASAEGYHVRAHVAGAREIEALVPEAAMRRLRLSSAKQAPVFVSFGPLHVLGPC